MSQNDTIELRGFEESDKLSKRKKRAAAFKERIVSKNEETAPGRETGEENASAKENSDKGRSTPAGQASKSETKVSQSPDPGAGGDTGGFPKAGEEKGVEGVGEQGSDNLDYFLSGSIPKLLEVSYRLFLLIRLIIEVNKFLVNS